MNLDINEILEKVRAEENKQHFTVLCPIEFQDKELPYELYGYFVETTGIFNILNDELISKENLKKLGSIGFEISEIGLCGVKKAGKLAFYYNLNEIPCEYYSLYADIYSRNTGIVESFVMSQKCAIIAGVGSGGSFIALELARSGVKHFILFDDDIFSFHNISRHQCGLFDVGKRKVDAVKERILAINPTAMIETKFMQIQCLDVQVLSNMIKNQKGIILSCGDNRVVDHYCNTLSEKLNIPFIAAGATARAVEGEIFWYIPRHGMPCYSCAFGEDVDFTRDNRISRVWYATEEELEKHDFTPGMAADIDYISVIVVKLAIDLLMLGEKNNGEKVYKPKILNQVSQYIRICNHLSELEDNIFDFSKSLEIKNAKVLKAKDCYLCNLLKKR